MKTVRFPLVVFLLFASCMSGNAQDKPAEKKFTLHSYGDTSQVALEAFGAALGYSVELPNEADDTGGSLENTCWFAFKDAGTEQATAVISFAIGLNVRVDHARKKVSANTRRSSAGRSTKGYDTSVLASRYVDYVNRFGAPKAASTDGKKEPDRTATEHLLDAIDEALILDNWGETGACCVGQRLLLNLTDAQHAELREFLSLLVSDKGGSNGALTTERTLRAALAKAPHNEEYAERPLGSVMGSLLSKNGGFVMAHTLAQQFSDQHVTRSKQDSESVSDVLSQLALQYEFAWSVGNGVVRITSRDYPSTSGYRVFELKELLDRLAAAYAGQRTQPGKTGGFEGDIKTQGGLDVIRNALAAQGESAGRAFGLHGYGTRLIVTGSADDIDAASAILKEMGFEEPKDE
jgi:hypothetical protein